MEYIPTHANRGAGSASVRGRVPDAVARPNGAAKRLGGIRPARAAGLDPRRAARPRVVAQPSVVLFWLRAADTMAAEDRADTFDDLKYYTEQIAPALESGGINLLATNADTVYVALPNHTRRAILLSGLDYPYGYLLIDPGGPERILTG